MLQSCQCGHAHVKHQCKHACNTYLPINIFISLKSMWCVYVAKVICSGFTYSRADVGQLFGCRGDVSSAAVTCPYYSNRSDREESLFKVPRYIMAAFYHRFLETAIITLQPFILIHLNLFVAEPQAGQRHLASDTAISGKVEQHIYSCNLSWPVLWPFHLHVVYLTFFFFFYQCSFTHDMCLNCL